MPERKKHILRSPNRPNRPPTRERRSQAATRSGHCSMARRLRGLLRLFEARLEAIDAGRDLWEFAVEIGVLRAAEGLTEPDLRWLAAERLVEFAAETTRGGQATRTFRRGGRFSLTDRTSFVISERAAAVLAGWCDVLAGALNGAPMSLPAVPNEHATTPRWNPANGELRLGGALVRRVEQAAHVLRMLLDAAQAARWAKHVGNPFDHPSPRARAKRLSHALERLNRGQVDAFIHFSVHEKGKQFSWTVTG